MTWTFDLSDTIRISTQNRPIRFQYHAYINKCIHANNGKHITWFRLNINCIGWWSGSKICVDQTTLSFFAPSVIFGSSIWKTGTKFLSWPLGDSLLFKSDLMPLLSPTLPRDPKGGSFNWLVHNLEMNASGEWDINSAYLSLCRVGMTRQSDSSIVFRW